MNAFERDLEWSKGRMMNRIYQVATKKTIGDYGLTPASLEDDKRGVDYYLSNGKTLQVKALKGDEGSLDYGFYPFELSAHGNKGWAVKGDDFDYLMWVRVVVDKEGRLILPSRYSARAYDWRPLSQWLVDNFEKLSARARQNNFGTAWNASVWLDTLEPFLIRAYRFPCKSSSLL
jgi:hypothetical protein